MCIRDSTCGIANQLAPGPCNWDRWVFHSDDRQPPPPGWRERSNLVRLVPPYPYECPRPRPFSGPRIVLHAGAPAFSYGTASQPLVLRQDMLRFTPPREPKCKRKTPVPAGEPALGLVMSSDCSMGDIGGRSCDIVDQARIWRCLLYTSRCV